HEAGHAVVFAYLGFHAPYVEMGLEPDPSGHTPGREIPVTDRIDFMATIHAGNVAVEDCAAATGYRSLRILPVTRPNWRGLKKKYMPALTRKLRLPFGRAKLSKPAATNWQP